MPDPQFAIVGAEAVAYAAVPQIVFRVAVTSAEPIRNLALQCQIQIEPVRRRYSEDEQRRLADLFGEPSRWGDTLKTLLWTHAPLTSGPFEGTTTVDVAVPCTFDFNVAVTKYIHGLDGGELPLRFLFSGSVFFTDAEDRLQITQLSWSSEATYRLPVDLWQRMMDLYYPNTAWLTLRRDVFDRLLHYKAEHGFATWETTVDALLKDAPPHPPAAPSPPQGGGEGLRNGVLSPSPPLAGEKVPEGRMRGLPLPLVESAGVPEDVPPHPPAAPSPPQGGGEGLRNGVLSPSPPPAGEKVPEGRMRGLPLPLVESDPRRGTV